MAMYIGRYPVPCTGSATSNSFVAARAMMGGAASATPSVAVDCRNLRRFMRFLAARLASDLGLSLTAISKSCANAFDETHVDDLVVLDVRLENIGAANDGARRAPGLSADHAVRAPQFIRKGTTEGSLEILERHGRELLLCDFGALVTIGI